MRVVKCFRTYSAAASFQSPQTALGGGRGAGEGPAGRLERVIEPWTAIGFDEVTPLNFHNPDLPCRQAGPTRLDWESITTGGVAGLILELARAEAGRIRGGNQSDPF